MTTEAKPTGECWCGCGQSTKGFFAATHDRTAEAAVIKLRYGNIAQFLAHHGFGPGGRNLRAELDALEAKERAEKSG